MNAVPRSCPTCHSIGKPKQVPGLGLLAILCNDAWHKPSPAARPADPLVRELADGLRRIEDNYHREGSGPGSRFEGKLPEDVQAEWLMRQLIAAEKSPLSGVVPLPLMPAGMTVSDMGEGLDLVCREHGVVLSTGEISLRTLSFEARRHWREKHHG
jgi:hypothetical protein